MENVRPRSIVQSILVGRFGAISTVGAKERCDFSSVGHRHLNLSIFSSDPMNQNLQIDRNRLVPRLEQNIIPNSCVEHGVNDVTTNLFDLNVNISTRFG